MVLPYYTVSYRFDRNCVVIAGRLQDWDKLTRGTYFHHDIYSLFSLPGISHPQVRLGSIDIMEIMWIDLNSPIQIQYLDGRIPPFNGPNPTFSYYKSIVDQYTGSDVFPFSWPSVIAMGVGIQVNIYATERDRSHQTLKSCDKRNLIVVATLWDWAYPPHMCKWKVAETRIHSISKHSYARSLLLQISPFVQSGPQRVWTTVPILPGGRHKGLFFPAFLPLAPPSILASGRKDA